MKNQVSPVLVVVAIVVVLGLAAGAYFMLEKPKSMPVKKGTVAQSLGNAMPQQPYVPTADGGKASGAAMMGGRMQQRPPMTPGAGGGMPQQPFVPGQ